MMIKHNKRLDFDAVPTDDVRFNDQSISEMEEPLAIPEYSVGPSSVSSVMDSMYIPPPLSHEQHNSRIDSAMQLFANDTPAPTTSYTRHHNALEQKNRLRSQFLKRRRNQFRMESGSKVCVLLLYDVEILQLTW